MEEVRTKQADEKFCESCGAAIKIAAELCPKCGVRQKDASISEKSWTVTLLLAIFGAVLALHRFYAGKIGTGILFLLTLGGFGIWYVIDIIMILTGKFKYAQGKIKIIKK